jgi:hypothetical protein
MLLRTFANASRSRSIVEVDLATVGFEGVGARRIAVDFERL